MDFVCVATVVSQHAGDFIEVLGEGDRVGFSIVPGLDGGEGFGVGFHEGGKLEQEATSVSGGQVAPGGRFKGCSGGGDGDVDIFGCGSVDRCDFGLVTLGKELVGTGGVRSGVRVVT